MAMSAPRLKRAIPMIRNNAQHEKITVSAIVKLMSGVQFKIKTINATGNTDSADSLNFIQSAFNMCSFQINSKVFSPKTYRW